MKKSCSFIIFIALTCIFLGPAWADEGKNESGKGRGHSPEAEYRDRDDRQYSHGDRSYKDRSYFHDHGYTRLDIPEGHYPPPGECRIWFPDRPAGHQAPPGSCSRLRANVPPGAWLIRHPEDLPGNVYVDVYDPNRPSSLMITGEFDIGTGELVRVVFSK